MNKEYNLIGCSCYWHWYSIFIGKGKSQPHVLLLMFQWKSRGVTVLDHSGSLQLKHWVSNSTQILPESNLSTLSAKNQHLSTKTFLVLILPIHQEEYKGQVHFRQPVQVPLKTHSSYWTKNTITNNHLRV